MKIIRSYHHSSTLTWSHLPPEIWLSILEFLDRTSLHNCSLASKDVNALCGGIIWAAIALPLYFSKRSRGFYLVAKALLAHPERARAARRMTFLLQSMQPCSVSQARYLYVTMPSQLEKLLSLMKGVTWLRLHIVDGSELSRFDQLRGHFKSFTPPLTIWSDTWHSNEEKPSGIGVEFFELLWTPILSWASTLPLQTLSTRFIPFHRFVEMTSRCPSIRQVEFVMNTDDQVSPDARIPPCQYLERVSHGEASVPVPISVNVLNSSTPPTSLILQSHHYALGSFKSLYEPLGQYIFRMGTVQVLTNTEFGTVRVEKAIQALSHSCPSLRVIVEDSYGYAGHQPNPLLLHVRVIASIFAIGPSLITYVSRRAEYDHKLWAPYRDQWPLQNQGGAAALADLLEKFRDNFVDIPTTRGVIRIILEAGRLNEEECLYWVFQRDRQGIWSMYWDTSTEGRTVTPKEREHFYLHPPIC
ncbi:hypothetical protein DL93DRAFT_2226723 [Clavulina sp. PMI_390]|nr:hypothetical protein DL93DRAFT_2226723 [Clavulina sp. PMI_390]